MTLPSHRRPIDVWNAARTLATASRRIPGARARATRHVGERVPGQTRDDGRQREGDDEREAQEQRDVASRTDRARPSGRDVLVAESDE